MNTGESSELHRDRLVFLLKTLEDMGTTLTGGESFDKAARYLLRMLLGSIGISNGAIFTFASKRKVLKLKDKTQIAACDFQELIISDELIRYLAENPVPHKTDELPGWIADSFGKMTGFWKKNNIRVMIPLAVKEDLLGMVCLGRRFMNQAYTDIDLEILGLMTQHISLYFHSQKSLEQLQHANFELRRKILEMEQLYEVALAVTSLKKPGDLLDEILTRATTILDARYGAVWLMKNKSYFLAGAFGFNKNDTLPDIMTDLSRTGPETFDFNPDKAVNLLAPMSIRNATIGVLSVAGKESRLGGFMDFSEADFQLLKAFANQAAVALENARLYVEAVEKERIDQEIKVAAEIQEAILPDAFPENPDLDISAMTLPCRVVGGDFFDFFKTADGKPAIVIADVSGKGVPAAMMVSTFHGALHAFSGFIDNLGDLAARINSLLVETTPDNKFVTAAFLVWNTETKEITTLSAGHEPLALIRPDGTITYLSQGGMILGLFPDVVYESQTLMLNKGDCLCLYTDGITDRTDSRGKRFGFGRFEKLLRETIGSTKKVTAAMVVQNIFRRLATFAEDEPAPDDQTLMIVIRR
jgi:phosphoserine phosphatase RsbU/P